jgi:hypothetical protein
MIFTAFGSFGLRICPSASPSWLYCWLWHEWLGYVQAISCQMPRPWLKWNSDIYIIYTCWIRTNWQTLTHTDILWHTWCWLWIRVLLGALVFCSTVIFHHKGKNAACQKCSWQDTCRICSIHIVQWNRNTDFLKCPDVFSPRDFMWYAHIKASNLEGFRGIEHHLSAKTDLSIWRSIGIYRSEVGFYIPLYGFDVDATEELNH